MIRRSLLALLGFSTLYMALVLYHGGLSFEIGGTLVRSEKLFIPGLLLVVPLVLLASGCGPDRMEDPGKDADPGGGGPEPPVPDPAPGWLLAGACLVLAAGWVTWGPGLHGGFIIDDYYVLDIVRHASLGDMIRFFARRTGGGEYRPLAVMTWWIDHRLHGLDPSWFHATNLVLHHMVGVLAGVLAWRLTRSGAVGLVSLGLFTLGPLHSETISWLIDRYDLMATGFLLASLILFVDAGRTGSRAAQVTSVMSMLAALLCKESVLTAPLALLLAGSLSGTYPDRGRLARGVAPHAAVWAAYLVWRMALFAGMGGYHRPAGLVDLPKIVAFPFSPLVSLGFPVNVPLIREAPEIIRGVTALALVAVPWLAIRRRHPDLHRVTIHLYLLVLAVSIPVYGVVNLSHTLQGSRYLYLPAVFHAMLLAWILATTRWRPGRFWLAAGLLATVFFAVARFNHAPWVAAGLMARQAVERAAPLARALRAGETVRVRGLVEDIGGALVFRGYTLKEGLEHYHGVDASRLQVEQSLSPTFAEPADRVFEWSPLTGFRQVEPGTVASP